MPETKLFLDSKLNLKLLITILFFLTRLKM
uniref:Uncharacterized protein n=1 Tax=Rhizophora mucronata TaxID=61149 RepID=A0A2P2IWZ3_RHIMU